MSIDAKYVADRVLIILDDQAGLFKIETQYYHLLRYFSPFIAGTY